MLFKKRQESESASVWREASLSRLEHLCDFLIEVEEGYIYQERNGGSGNDQSKGRRRRRSGGSEAQKKTPPNVDDTVETLRALSEVLVRGENKDTTAAAGVIGGREGDGSEACRSATYDNFQEEGLSHGRGDDGLGLAGGDSRVTFLESFAEKNMMAHIVSLLKRHQCPARVQIQILQTFLILITNVKSEMALFYLLSNNHMNDLILHQGFNLEDEEVLSHFLSLLRTLSARLNERTVGFFLKEQPCLSGEGSRTVQHNESSGYTNRKDSGIGNTDARESYGTCVGTSGGDCHSNKEALGEEDAKGRSVCVSPAAHLSSASVTFPLYTRAVEYICHSDNHIRTTALTTLLSICSVRDSGVEAYLMHPDASALLLTPLMRSLHSLTDALADLNTPTAELEDCIAKLTNQIYFLQDLFLCSMEEFNRTLNDCIIKDFVAPLLRRVVRRKNGMKKAEEVISGGVDENGEDSDGGVVRQQQVALFVITSLVEIVTACSPLILAIADLLLATQQTQQEQHQHQHQQHHLSSLDAGALSPPSSSLSSPVSTSSSLSVTSTKSFLSSFSSSSSSAAPSSCSSSSSSSTQPCGPPFPSPTPPPVLVYLQSQQETLQLGTLLLLQALWSSVAMQVYLGSGGGNIWQLEELSVTLVTMLGETPFRHHLLLRLCGKAFLGLLRLMYPRHLLHLPRRASLSSLPHVDAYEETSETAPRPPSPSYRGTHVPGGEAVTAVLFVTEKERRSKDVGRRALGFLKDALAVAAMAVLRAMHVDSKDSEELQDEGEQQQEEADRAHLFAVYEEEVDYWVKRGGLEGAISNVGKMAVLVLRWACSNDYSPHSTSGSVGARSDHERGANGRGSVFPAEVGTTSPHVQCLPAAARNADDLRRRAHGLRTAVQAFLETRQVQSELRRCCSLEVDNQESCRCSSGHGSDIYYPDNGYADACKTSGGGGSNVTNSIGVVTADFPPRSSAAISCGMTYCDSLSSDGLQTATWLQLTGYSESSAMMKEGSTVCLKGCQCVAAQVIIEGSGKGGEDVAAPPSSAVLDVYLIIDPNLFVLAAPDKRVLNDGQILAAAPLQRVYGMADEDGPRSHERANRNSKTRRLGVVVLSPQPVGLMTAGTSRAAAAGGGQSGRNGGTGLGVNGLETLCYFQAWRCTLLFDNNLGRSMVMDHIESSRRRLQEQKRQTLKEALLLQYGPPPEISQARSVEAM